MSDLASLEALIRAGEFAKVRKALSELNSKKIPREDLVRFANLANRSDFSRMAMRLLHPIVHSEQEAIAPAGDQERIEYADALRRSGLINEAREILLGVDASKNPTVHLQLSFCYFNEWRYSQAFPHLRQLVSATKPEDYLHTIAKVNLAAALVHEELNEEALTLLEEIQESTRAKGQILLLGNSLELTSQALMRQGKWEQAEQTLNRAEEVFGQDHNKYLFYVRKWRAIVGSLKSGSVQDELLQLRELAREKQDWESERDCDLHIAVIKRDFELLRKVYFGTPYLSYRRRILRMAGEGFSLPEKFVWSNSVAPKQIFDVVSAACENGLGAIDEGSLPHQMMMLLASDFYRPISIGSAFSTLFRGEHFGQQGSANRVCQLVMKLRRNFADAGVGISITETKGKYRIQLAQDCGLRVLGELPNVSREDLSWLKARTQLPQKSFSRRDLELATQYSPAKVKRLLRWAIDHGQIRSIGYGPNTKYEFAA